jgi:hypothetical protein
VRRELGSVFSQVIKSGTSDSLEAISTLLSDGSSIHSGIMRTHITDVYNNMSIRVYVPRDSMQDCCKN